jgi:hypothetical protein
MTEDRRSPISRFGGLCGSGATPSQPQDPSPPHGLAVRGSPTLLQPMGAKGTVLVIDHRRRIVDAYVSTIRGGGSAAAGAATAAHQNDLM